MYRDGTKVHLMRPAKTLDEEPYWTYCGIEGPGDHIQTTVISDMGRTTCKKCRYNCGYFGR